MHGTTAYSPIHRNKNQHVIYDITNERFHCFHTVKNHSTKREMLVAKFILQPSNCNNLSFVHVHVHVIQNQWFKSSSSTFFPVVHFFPADAAQHFFQYFFPVHVAHFPAVHYFLVQVQVAQHFFQWINYFSMLTLTAINTINWNSLLNKITG